MSAREQLTPRREKVRADIAEREDVMMIGEPAIVEIEVTNLDDVIRSFHVSILGIDPRHVVIDPPVVALFPEERETVTAVITLPPDHPAGRRTLAVEVVEPRENAPAPAVAEFLVDLQGMPSLAVQAEPATLECGAAGTFVVHLVNTGNTALEVELVAQDPERLVEVVFEPANPSLQPGEKGVVRGSARGPRPWVGMPVVRVLQVTATGGGASAVTALAMLQRPRLSRRLISMLGVLLVVTLFAYIIALSFGRVAELSAQNEALVRQGLGFDDEETSRVAPAAVDGQVASSTGAGIGGATIQLFSADNLLQPVQTTVTDDAGNYRFGAVPDGEYLVRTEAAGFGQTWFPGSPGPEGAEPVAVVDGKPVADLAFVLSGRPGSLVGSIIGADVAGALVAVRLPADSITDSTVAPVAAVVRAVEIDATGLFVLGDLATPATYEIAVSKPGYATDVRTVTLKAGEQRGNIEILLRRGIGLVAGSVVDTAGQPVGGVAIRATDGTSESTTRSLSGADVTGTFELRDLTTPGTYTISFTRPGFFEESATVVLEAEQQRDDLVVVMTRNSGTLGGAVRSADGRPLGGVTVSVVGVDLVRTTQTLSVGDVGGWFVDALPVPGTYTVTFQGNGFTTTALSVDLGSGPEADRRGIDGILTTATASLSGIVRDSDGEPVGGVEITLERSGEERRTISSDIPPGAYVFDAVPPGVYTLTYRQAGSTPETLLVDLAAGDQLSLADVQLEAQARVGGIVTRDGVGTAGIGVIVYRVTDYPGGIVTATVTGVGGAFELVGLEAPETYIIDFQVPAGGPVVQSRVVFLRPDESTELRVDL